MKKVPFLLTVAALIAVVSNCSSQKPPDPEETCLEQGCPDGSVCDIVALECQQGKPCQSDTSCQDAGTGLCPSGTCVGCRSGAPCTVGVVACDPATGLCAGCDDDGDCGGALPRCNAGACLECASDAHCSGARPLCEDGYCVACRLDSECATGTYCTGGLCTPRCSNSSQCPAEAPECSVLSCAVCSSDSDCGEGQACLDRACRSVPVGLSCQAPYALDLSSGSAIVSGNVFPTEEHRLHRSAAFYRFTTDREILLSGVAAFAGAQIGDLAVFVDGPGCEDPYLWGSSGRTFGTPLEDVFLVPGTYVVAVMAASNQHDGRFTAHLWWKPGTRVAGNDCLKMIPVILDENGQARVRAELTSTLEDVPGAWCGTNSNWRLPGLLFTVEVPYLAQLDVTAHPVDPALDVRLTHDTDCLPEDPTLSTCANPADAGAPETLSTRQLPPGKYAYIVQREGGTTGAFDLEVNLNRWATNDGCDANTPALDLSSGTATVNGDSRYSTGNGGFRCRCEAMDCAQHDVYYRFSTVGMGVQNVTVSISTQQAGYTPQVALLTSCSGTNLVACAPNPEGLATTSVVHEHLPEGEYVLQVAGKDDTAGTFSLTVMTQDTPPAPANDTCAGAEAITLVADGTLTTRSDTSGANDEFTGWCGSVQASSYDVVYAPVNSTGNRGYVTFTVTPTTTTFDPWMYLTPTVACPVPGATNMTDCAASAGPGASETIRVPTMGSDDWLLVIDGAAKTEGAFTLASKFEASPAHDQCANALDLGAPPMTAPVSGSLVLMFHDEVFGDCSMAAEYGPDAFYKFRLAAGTTKARPTTVTVTPTGFDASFVILQQTSGTCTSTTDACLPGWTTPVNSGAVGQAETYTFSAQPNVTYVVMVDAFVQQTGTFTIEVK